MSSSVIGFIPIIFEDSSISFFNLSRFSSEYLLLSPVSCSSSDCNSGKFF